MKKKLILFTLILAVTQLVKAQAPNWSDNVASIIYSHCSNCHRAGGLAPFPLMSFNDVDSNSVSIYDAVLNKVMPPWKADPNYVHFKGEFNLTQQEITDITSWINNGKPTGNLANAPAPPVFQVGSQLPAVDMTLNLPVFVVDSVADQYRTFVVHSNFTSDTYINAVEYVPGNNAIVHHIVIYNDPTSASWNFDQADPAPGYASNGTMAASTDAQFMGAWAPGAGIFSFPNNFGIKVPAGADFLVEVHYAPGSQGETDSTKVNFKFITANASTREVYFNALLEYFTGMTDGPLYVPANTVHTFHEAQPIVQIGAPISLISFWPHMHRVGTSFKAWAQNLAGDTVRLGYVPAWDFHWQLIYNYKKLIPLFTDQVIIGEAVYDNTTANTDNPFSPPHDIYSGEHTTDEMMLGFFAFTIYQSGDENFIIDSSVATGNNTIANEPLSVISVYPNPASNQLNVNLLLKNESQQTSIKVLNETGVLVYDNNLGRVPTGLRSHRIDIDSWSSGTYFIKVKTSDGEIMTKEFVRQ
ncbi:hypothetical protein LBMAG27_11730 [Bacteroidota bacterium]|nr:hypothetical protein LBMAG27_11730 [Bacteroidota bacterium]